MFVATTLALSLVFSPVTALTHASPLAPAPAASATPAVADTAAPASAAPASVPASPKPAAPAPAAAPAPEPAKPAAAGPAKAACAKLDYRTRVEVDAGSLGDDAQGVATRLRGKAEQELQRNDIMLGATDSADLPVMKIKVVPLPGEDEGFSFTIDFNHADHHPIKDGSSVGECPLCTESELLEKIVGATRALTPKLRAYVADFNNKPCGPPPPATCSAAADCKDPALPKCDQKLKQCVAADECSTVADCVGNANGEACHPVIKKCVQKHEIPKKLQPGGWNGKQKVGVALMVVGAVGAGVGIGLMVKKPVAPDPYRAWEYNSTKNPGIALLAVGGAALVSGIIVFALGRRQQTRSQVTPVAGAGVYGLSWSGRF